MSNQWTATEIAQMENRRFIWRDAKLLVLPLAPMWAALVGLSLVAGLSWRFVPGSHPPSIYTLLDICGLALWIAGWRVGDSLAGAMRRRELYQRNQVEFWPRMAFIALALLGASVGLALAPCGSLLGYNSPTILQEISTQDIAQLNVSLGGIVIIALALGGACCVLASCLSALLALRFGRRFSGLLWLLAAFYANLSTMGGLADHIRRTDTAGEMIFSWVPPTLGILTRISMAKLADPGIRYEYVKPLSDSTLGLALLWLLGLLAANVLLSLVAIKAKQQHATLTLSSLAGVLAAAIYELGKQWVYVADAAVPSPGDWRAVLAIGLLTSVVGYWLLGSSSRNSTRGWRDFWPLVTLVFCIALTAPQIQAGQVSRPEVLIETIVLLPLYVLTLTLLRRWRSFDIEFGWRSTAATMCFALVLLPLFGGISMVEHMRLWSMEAEHLYVATCAMLLLLLEVYRANTPPTFIKRDQTIDLRPAA